MNAFATAISIGLQYGVPLETLRAQVRVHAVRAGGDHPQPGDPVREVDARLHHALAGLPLPRRRPARGARHPHRPRSARARRPRRRSCAATRRRRAGRGRRGNGGNGTRNAGHGRTRPRSPAAAALTDEPPVIPAKLQGLELGPACAQCGGMMQRTGSCYTCSSCGNNTGCGWSRTSGVALRSA